MTQPMLNPTRRGFLQFGMAAMACAVARPVMALPLAPAGGDGIRSMAFHNLHTDERLRIAYWANGQYDRAGWAQINHILRDHYSGDSRVMDIRLIDLLWDLQRKLGNDNPIEIISGYRSPATNATLRRLTDGVAKQSYHTKGMAMDIRLTGTSLSQLHDTALAMRRGGVGYYPDSQFVHMDVGPVRMW